jgi:hypothetical protein
VCQRAGARNTGPAPGGFDARLIVRLARQPTWLLGIAGAATLSRSRLLDDDNPDPPCPAPPAVASATSPPRRLPVAVGRP